MVIHSTVFVEVTNRYLVVKPARLLGVNSFVQLCEHMFCVLCVFFLTHNLMINSWNFGFSI